MCRQELNFSDWYIHCIIQIQTQFIRRRHWKPGIKMQIINFGCIWKQPKFWNAKIMNKFYFFFKNTFSFISVYEINMLRGKKQHAYKKFYLTSNSRWEIHSSRSLCQIVCQIQSQEKRETNRYMLLNCFHHPYSIQYFCTNNGWVFLEN